ncbi:MAG: tetratricopeptide repeat protein [Candidatus Omnitrophota bacterium]|jgi:tetratricopeptide (TPR) repeat protein
MGARNFIAAAIIASVLMGQASCFADFYQDVEDKLRYGDTEGAEAILKKRLAVNSRDTMAAYMLGSIYLENGDKKSALKYLNIAVSLNPEYPVPHFYLGKIYFSLSDFDKAREEFSAFRQMAMLLSAEDEESRTFYVDALYSIAESYYMLKEYEDYKGVIDEILQHDPKDATAHYNLGVYFYVAKHDRPKAYNEFVRAIEFGGASDISEKSKYAVEFMRNNPDPRVEPDFSFLGHE